MARKKQPEKMTGEELLIEFRNLFMWFGDDFAITRPSRHDENRSCRLEDEILRRMHAGEKVLAAKRGALPDQAGAHAGFL